jgi:hypothetical protein
MFSNATRHGIAAMNSMVRTTALGLGIVLGVGIALAQDIPGVEDCTKTSGLDKRTGCLQSNVNFLHQLVMKNALDARQRLTAANAEIVALRSEIAALKVLAANLQKSVEQLQAVQKAADDKKPGTQ